MTPPENHVILKTSSPPPPPWAINEEWSLVDSSAYSQAISHAEWQLNLKTYDSVIK